MVLALLAGGVFCGGTTCAAAHRDWLAAVPPQERLRVSPIPMADSPDAVAAGAILFHRSCASCHGEDARGLGKRPGLRSERVREASEGELHWLLTNGNLAAGMPSWSRLPEGSRWQLVRYLHALPVDASSLHDGPTP
ncbi:MAG: cytochrome c [Acidobacteriota bacterium]|nr:cytochrome c [Acidobacteriota bacterium]